MGQVRTSRSKGNVLGAEYYSSDALALASDMLGKVLCRRSDDGVVRRYRITETEAYFGEDDTACHAHRCPTGRARGCRPIGR